MPAIDLARLKIQAAQLGAEFAEPEAFARGLHEVLDYYTNRTIRASQLAQRISLPTYRTPRPVLRQIESELEPLADAHPIEAVNLANALWKAGYFETRLLASRLVGFIPPAQAMPLLSLIPDWLQQSKDRVIQQAILTDAFVRIRKESPDAFLLLLEDWLKSQDRRMQSWGLSALVPLLSEPGFENLPAVFRIIHPTVEAASHATQLDLRACLRALESHSPTETLVFLREVILAKPDPQMIRILRRILPALSTKTQAELREALKAQP